MSFGRKLLIATSKKNLTSPLLTPSLLSDDDNWIIDTDYDNYAIHYSCRLIDSDGTCLDSYSLIFSRHVTGLRPEDQVIVHQKKMDLCLLGKYRRVAHTGRLHSHWFVLLIHAFDQQFETIRLKTKGMINWVVHIHMITGQLEKHLNSFYW